MTFCQSFGLSKYLPDEKMALKKALPDGNLSLKYHYRTGICLSNIITGQKFGFQKSLPDGNRPVMIFESPILVR